VIISIADIGCSNIPWKPSRGALVVAGSRSYYGNRKPILGKGSVQLRTRVSCNLELQLVVWTGGRTRCVDAESKKLRVQKQNCMHTMVAKTARNGREKRANLIAEWLTQLLLPVMVKSRSWVQIPAVPTFVNVYAATVHENVWMSSERAQANEILVKYFTKNILWKIFYEKYFMKNILRKIFYITYFT